jgi:DNA polymerase III subunit epsilon
MEREKGQKAPQHGVLLRRAHELLEHTGKPVAEELLIEHLFGVTDAGQNRAVWSTLLHQILQSSTLFEEREPHIWSLHAWHATQLRLDEIEFAIIDTETTGLRPGSHRVIEIAGVRIRGNGEVIGSYQSLINPGVRIPNFIAQFTGISQEMVTKAPRTHEVLPDFLSFIDGATLVGHNVAFDIGFLTYEAQLLGQSFPIDGLDTIPLARRFLSGLKRFKLDSVAAHLRIPTSDRHRALGDAKVTAAVFLKLLELARKQDIQTLGQLRRRLQLPVAWSGDITQTTTTRQLELLRSDGKLASTVTTRPTGTLFLNPAWKRDFPTQPGVYLMKDEQGTTIYVGKAKCLRDRLSSYYSQPLGYTRKMDGLLQNVKEIETRILGSELEALLVESQLIKQLQPAYNVQLRNYELYPFIKIDIQHTFPRIYATREVAADGARYFGPFRSKRLVDLTIELVQKVFPVRTCTRALPPQAKPSDPCLRLHLNRCSAPCRGDADPLAYSKVIEEICAFLGGEREDLLDRLRRQMLEASHQLNFERAAWLRDTIRCADEVLIGQRLITGAVEANNLLIVYPSARETSNELFLIRHGRLIEQRCVTHQPESMQLSVDELVKRAIAAGDHPAIVGQAEVDQINIISRWIHHHSDDRAFYPIQSALADPTETQLLAQQIWRETEAMRGLLASNLHAVSQRDDDIQAG